MEKTVKPLIIVCIALLVAACTKDVTTERNFSGFLDDYSQLERVELKSGGVGLIWLHPEISSLGYTKIIVEPVVIYPEPRHDSDEARQLIDQVTRYLDASASSAIGQTLIITDNPGPNTARLKIAMTGVEISTEGLSGTDYIPVAALWAGATTVAGTRAQAVEVFLEAEMTDSQTGEVLGRAVRKGLAESLEDKSETLTLEKMYPQLDAWAEDAANLARQLNPN